MNMHANSMCFQTFVVFISIYYLQYCLFTVKIEHLPEKGNLARQMFLVHPELKKELWGGHLWNPSYCAVTVSDRSREQVSAYIEGQKEKEKRKP